MLSSTGRSRRHAVRWACAALLSLAPLAASPAQDPEAALHRRVCAAPVRGPGVECWSYSVAENKETGEGRRLDLDVVQIHALDPSGAAPIFFLAGGPGQAATDRAPALLDSALRQHHDLVLADQRGTAGNHLLDCDLTRRSPEPGSDRGEVFARVTAFRACRDELARERDLGWYSTPVAMSDLDEIRAALGYDRIVPWGASYGTRAGLEYLRRYSERVAAAILDGAAPVRAKNPLYHAQSAQLAFDEIARLCSQEAACERAHGDIAVILPRVLAELRENPVSVDLPDDRGAPGRVVVIDDSVVAETIRTLLYGVESARSVPILVAEAGRGDFAAFARAAVASSRALSSGLALGMLMAVVCGEDAPRITEDEIVGLTAGTFLGDRRVRSQLRACEGWPPGRWLDSYEHPVEADAPVLVMSGTADPVTPAVWGEEVAAGLPRGWHVVLAGSHGVSSTRCGLAIAHAFIDDPSRAPDTSCAASLRIPPFVVAQ